jgi:inhibitor of nuclear factor kappa-B kinase subunit alpha
LKEIGQTRAKRLLQLPCKKGHENFLFMDEKIFTNKEQYNNQYNKIYAQMSLDMHAEGTGGHDPSYVMIWLGVVPSGGVIPLHFCEKDLKAGAQVYQKDVLQGVVKLLNMTVFSVQKWVFQQKSAPAHKAEMT